MMELIFFVLLAIKPVKHVAHLVFQTVILVVLPNNSEINQIHHLKTVYVSIDTMMCFQQLIIQFVRHAFKVA